MSMTGELRWIGPRTELLAYRTKTSWKSSLVSYGSYIEVRAIFTNQVAWDYPSEGQNNIRGEVLKHVQL